MNSTKTYIDHTWDTSIIPALKEYIAIPALSPGFEADWEKKGYLTDSLKLAERWCRDQELENTDISIVSEPGRTPLLLVEVGAFNTSSGGTTLFYGHLDKQPEAEGWDENKGPWTPVIEEGKLYGRGSADDGYAVFTAVTAIKTLQVNNLSHGRCVILIETCEESGSLDLPHYLETCKKIIGEPELVVCLDSGINDYEGMWLTASLRGVIEARLDVSLLTQGIHSGGSGMVASSFRVMRTLLDRVEDAGTGDILIGELHTKIPEERLSQIREAAEITGDSLAATLPLADGVRPMAEDPATLILNSSWKPMLSYIGADGFPETSGAGNVLRPSTSILLSVRTPPPVDTAAAAETLKSVLEKDPPFNAKVRCEVLGHARGWDMPSMGDKLNGKIIRTAESVFGKRPAYVCEGGTIPLMTMLLERFPGAKFIITGVLGPNANAHGPNEFLHIPYAKKLTLAVSQIIAEEED
ncbi:MAG: M20/M25/M40 family metallo-hydrolase [Desulfobacterales bacterium]|nr:M20/M25/M40 family metallo-hydrolase [Desulfobacterales bacterium]